MKRMIDFRALAALLVALGVTGAAILWAWLDHLEDPGEITCSKGGVTVPTCSTNFGDWVLLIAFVATPVILVLTHKAFFTRFGRRK